MRNSTRLYFLPLVLFLNVVNGNNKSSGSCFSIYRTSIILGISDLSRYVILNFDNESINTSYIGMRTLFYRKNCEYNEAAREERT